MNGNLNTAYQSPENSTGFMLWRTTNSWQRQVRATLKPFGLTHVQFVLLAVLASMDRTNPARQRDLAERAMTDAMMTSQVLRALQGKGLVALLAHPTDGRARIVTITAAGLALVNRANTAVEEADRKYFAALRHAEQDFTYALATLDAEHSCGTSKAVAENTDNADARRSHRPDLRYDGVEPDTRLP